MNNKCALTSGTLMNIKGGTVPVTFPPSIKYINKLLTVTFKQTDHWDIFLLEIFSILPCANSWVQLLVDSWIAELLFVLIFDSWFLKACLLTKSFPQDL